jgi:hypothetical protein
LLQHASRSLNRKRRLGYLVARPIKTNNQTKAYELITPRAFHHRNVFDALSVGIFGQYRSQN